MNDLRREFFPNGISRAQPISIGSGGLSLRFSNGQTVGIAANGKFTVFRPWISGFTPDSSARVVLDTNGAPSIYLGLGDKNNSGGGMGWTLTVNLDASFPGALFYEQLIDREWSWDRNLWWGHVPKSDTTGGYWLDNGSPYTEATVINNSARHDHLTMHFGDGPSLEDAFYSFADTPDTFKAYLRFQPAGGIPVTIGRVDWGWRGRADGSCSTSTWTLTTNSVTWPTLDSSDDSFPIWPRIYHNTGGN